MEQTARFISRPRRIEELRDFGIGMLRPYQIVSTVCLGGIDYENFVTDLLAEILADTKTDKKHIQCQKRAAAGMPRL